MRDMKYIPATLALCLVVGTTAFAQKTADKKQPAVTKPAAKPAVQDVTVDAAEKLIEARKDLVVLDVRTIEEYDMAHIPGAKNASFIDTKFDEQLKEFEGKPVLVHCAAGNRSLRAVMKMQAEGKFPEIYHLPGGFTAWQEAGKSVAKTVKPK